jgi:hypothetical protein
MEMDSAGTIIEYEVKDLPMCRSAVWKRQFGQGFSPGRSAPRTRCSTHIYRGGVTSDKEILAVVGATGAQGGGLMRAILDDPSGGFGARAITRPDYQRNSAHSRTA